MSELQYQNLDLNGLPEGYYDLVVSALGFESRAIALSGKLRGKAKRNIAIGFDHNKSISYSENKLWFSANVDYVYDDVSDEQFVEIIRREISQSLECSVGNGQPCRVAFDVSCLNRYRIATIIAETTPHIFKTDLNADVWYALAEFQPPSKSNEQNEVVGPVHGYFSGLFGDPSRPLALVAGLGYEEGKVMGATEYLQASRVVAFFPKSPINEYEQFVEEANQSLLSELDARDVIIYPVNDPARTLATLDSAVRGLEETYNVVILPLGPKIFTVLALFAHLSHNDSSVWRVSGGRRSAPRDVRASGHYFGLTISTS